MTLPAFEFTFTLSSGWDDIVVGWLLGGAGVGAREKQKGLKGRLTVITYYMTGRVLKGFLLVFNASSRWSVRRVLFEALA